MTEELDGWTWERDCERFFGKVLLGKYGHWCPDWDYLPIDETVDEFECCTCNKELIKKLNENANT